jgi:hypothetical protein
LNLLLRPQNKGFNCDNRLRSDKRRHFACRTFVSTSALARADMRYEFYGVQ